MTMEVWLRPWAYYAPHRRITLPPGGTAFVPTGHDASVLLFSPGTVPPTVDGSLKTIEPVARLRLRHLSGLQTDRDVETTLSLLPFPVRHEPAARIAGANGSMVSLSWPEAPERFRSNTEPQTEAEGRAKDLMLRAEAVWDRISDVDELLGDPASLWPSLRDRWMGRDAGEPKMDVIVKQARELSRVIDALEARPRKILRRVHRQVPVARVQEVDRRSMLWLARQPGETLAERAGDDQRVLAVAREENFDTLENRVLRAYGDLAARHARDYLARNRTRRQSMRAIMVERFAKRCHRMARELSDRGVRAAEPGVTPNFVLQQNPLYQTVWKGWIELLKIDQTRDELWRWQARSWDEFCSLALMVALSAVPGAQPVATSPIWFRNEHHRGHWIEADTPLGVVYLPNSGLIVEVQRTHAGLGTENWVAPIWLRVGRLADPSGFLSHIPVWPIWSPFGGLSAGEASEVASLLERVRPGHVRGGIVLRPTIGPDDVDVDRSGTVLAAALGTEGAALRDTLAGVTRHLSGLFGETSE
jgi:hypothetical protein